ncbi:MAG TPA: hypothetical protein VFR95_14575 [Gemmatimonadaceae bacterium]|nr:hypothetical protein [Gemmatimonadaceae bacterium]
MANENLITYLNDHLAGAVAALDLLGRLESADIDDQRAQALAELHADIAADRQELEALIARLKIDESRTRQAMAWIAGRLSHLKLRVDDPEHGALGWLEAFDALAMGIEGKRALWRALAAAAELEPELVGVDYERLTRRAEDQRARVEAMRLEAAKKAFTS